MTFLVCVRKRCRRRISSSILFFGNWLTRIYTQRSSRSSNFLGNSSNFSWNYVSADGNLEQTFCGPLCLFRFLIDLRTDKNARHPIEVLVDYNARLRRDYFWGLSEGVFSGIYSVHKSMPSSFIRQSSFLDTLWTKSPFSSKLVPNWRSILNVAPFSMVTTWWRCKNEQLEVRLATAKRITASQDGCYLRTWNCSKWKN